MKKDLMEFWEIVLSELEKKNISPITYNTWFKSIEPKNIDFDQKVLTLIAPTKFIKEYMLKNNKHMHLMKSVLYDITAINFEIEILLLNSGTNNETNMVENPKPLFSNNLNQKYTFENFVVGKSNEFANAASIAVADAIENPSSIHSNPLFLYGGVGLGKTHLIQAIGNKIKKTNPDKRSLYVTSERFTNEFINCIRSGKNEEFRKKYRYVDLLMIDDIQFMSNKEGTQEEFFHTFNALYENNKQIVFTADKAPKEIKNVEERLVSRFTWGLVVDISQPDLETRIAILNSKAYAENFNVPKDVIYFIAENVKSNIRELEGALSRIVAYSKITVGELTVEDASEVLKDLYKNDKPKKIDAKSIKSFIAKEYNLTIEEMDSKKRTKAIAYPRQIAMYITRELTDLSLPKIGEVFGGRDHTTVIHAYEKIQKDIKEDHNMQKMIENYFKEIRGC